MNTWLIYLQAELGDIVYVELPEVGSEVKKGEQFGVIESVKVGDFFCSSKSVVFQCCCQRSACIAALSACHPSAGCI